MIPLEDSDLKDTDVKKQNKDFSIEELSTGVVFLIEILMEEIDLVVAQD